MTRLRAFGLAGLMVALLAGAATPAAAIDEKAAARLVAEQFGVQVLKVRPGTVDGRAVWLVTGMNPGGNSNSAFVVSTVAVDVESGRPLRSFQPVETGSLPLAGAPAAENKVVTGTPPGPGSREAGDGAAAPR
ncbi:hypothetical protein SAMN06265365_108126 [Tistlia consotensis]|uniref:Peptidase propeptide and YPEB domain-containing protein n=1 Tax=Tistlia consotensis USBA 355 TaxID=560819 RepID=A0A1Y6BT84_9PROT|nr:hypothetical protein [Tistlia consotensis]SMF23935.1 hypothetical protein SAMN05428998_10854 [Tistlia consotensis USBA 355]SNR61094.1 hypothetical protein SAMN06265365_108126 [Tistlia consotensis]